jgi:hypothetical protein
MVVFFLVRENVDGQRLFAHVRWPSLCLAVGMLDSRRASRDGRCAGSKRVKRPPRSLN